MRKLQYFGIITMISGLVACGNATKTETSQTEEVETKKCTYEYNEGSLKVQWTAFKTTEKIGVAGSFDTLSVSGVKTGNSTAEVFEEASFSIPVKSINSNNPERDGKILESFFGTMTETTLLSGKVLDITQNDCNVLITMNGVSDTCLFNLTQNDSLVSLSGELELGNWDALESADALNKVCFDLHKGADGVSKLWPDVKLEITAGITSTCD